MMLMYQLGGGTQSGKITFDVDQTTNQFLENPIFDFGKTVNPDNISSTFSVKSNNTGIKFQLAVKTFDADGNDVESFFAGVENVVAADTWESFSLIIVQHYLLTKYNTELG